MLNFFIKKIILLLEVIRQLLGGVVSSFDFILKLLVEFFAVLELFLAIVVVAVF